MRTTLSPSTLSDLVGAPLKPVRTIVDSSGDGESTAPIIAQRRAHATPVSTPQKVSESSG